MTEMDDFVSVGATHLTLLILFMSKHTACALPMTTDNICACKVKQKMGVPQCTVDAA